MCFTIFLNEKTPVYSTKTRSSKSQKIDTIPNGLTHGFGPKIVFFPTFCFQAIQARKMCLTIFYIKKTPLQAIKTKNSKSRKIHIFPKGLVHGFGLKMAVFPTLIFQAIWARKMSFSRFQNEKTPLQTIKKRRSYSRKIGFGPKMALFPTFFFKQYRPGKCLLGYSRTKKRFLRV